MPMGSEPIGKPRLYGMVPAISAMCSRELSGPKMVTSSPTSTPGASERSIMHMSMQILPRTGAGPSAVIRA